MTSERVRGAVLWTAFAVLLLGGGAWWVSAAPETSVAPAVAAWQAAVLEKLPESDNRAGQGMVTLSPGTREQQTADVRSGFYLVSVVCAGPGLVRITLSTTGNDSGRSINCADNPDPIALQTGLGNRFTLTIFTDETGPAVLRWALQRLSD